MCETVKLGIETCKILDVEAFGKFCDIPKVASDIFEAVVEPLADGLHNLLSFDIRLDHVSEAYVNSSKTTKEIQFLVQQDFHSYTKKYENWSNMIRKISLAFPIFLLLVQSYKYLKLYLNEDKHDNVYITKKFTCDNNLGSLTKCEKKWLIDTTSLRLSQAEKSLFRTAIFKLLFHTMLAIAICFFEHFLYILLVTIRKHGDIKIELRGEQSFTLAVEGGGLFAPILDTLLGGKDIGAMYNNSMDNTMCLPDPVNPNIGYYVAIGVFYLFALIMALLQAYALRVRPKIAGYFYPERKHHRSMYLYDKIKRKRENLKTKFAKPIQHQNHPDANCSNRAFKLVSRFPCFKKVFGFFRKSESICEGCGSPGENRKCNSLSHNVVFCEECYNAICVVSADSSKRY